MFKFCYVNFINLKKRLASNAFYFHFYNHLFLGSYEEMIQGELENVEEFNKLLDFLSNNIVICMNLTQLNNEFKYIWQYYFIRLSDFDINFIKFQNENFIIKIRPSEIRSSGAMDIKTKIELTLLSVLFSDENKVTSIKEMSKYKNFDVFLLIFDPLQLLILNSSKIFQKINIEIKPIKNEAGIINLIYFNKVAHSTAARFILNELNKNNFINDQFFYTLNVDYLIKN